MRQISGEPFQWTDTIDPRQPRADLYWSRGGEVVVKPGQSAVLALPAQNAMMSDGFSRDRRFSAAGRRFAIALPLCEQVVGTYGSPGAKSTLMTTEAEIELVNPARSDLAVWNLIQETSRPWSPYAREMWEIVLRDFPDSSYVPYAVLMTGIFTFEDWRDLLARQLRAIERFPDSPVVEWLHVEAWRTARALRLHGVMLAEGAILRKSKRPTTRLLAFPKP